MTAFCAGKIANADLFVNFSGSVEKAILFLQVSGFSAKGKFQLFGGELMILITGSEGLVGRATIRALADRGISCRQFDIARDPGQDTRNERSLEAAVEGVDGVLHLAAVSRVVWAQRDPKLAQEVNVAATQKLVDTVIRQKTRPWMIFASSREVYGEQGSLPVHEDAELSPMNIYARSKVAGEQMVAAAREAGVVSNIVRLSNVYGCTRDHADRVVTAFAHTAALGGELRLDGPENMFDFTHVDDVARGLVALIEATQTGKILPPIHLLTGRGTTLQMLADLAGRVARKPVSARNAPSRTYDVARFYGDPSRAKELLGWQAEVDIETGFARLADNFFEEAEAKTSSLALA